MGDLSINLYITSLPSEVSMTITKPNSVSPASPAGAQHTEAFKTANGKTPDYPYKITEPSGGGPGDIWPIGVVELSSDLNTYGPQLEIPYEVKKTAADDKVSVHRQGRILVETTWWSSNRPTHCLVSYEWQKERKTLEIPIPEDGASNLDINAYFVVGYKASEKRVGINGTADRKVAIDLKENARELVPKPGSAGWLAVLI